MGLFSWFKRNKQASELDYVPHLTKEQEAALKAKRESGIPEYTQEDLELDPNKDPMGYYKSLVGKADNCPCRGGIRKKGDQE